MPPTSQPAYICAQCARTLAQRPSSSLTGTAARRALSISTTRRQSEPTEWVHDTGSPEQQPPRWLQTPAAMRMPYRLRPLPKQPVWRVNEEQEPLDAVYDSFLARVEGNIRGRDMLDEETKWLAVTHKSFDHGRRGFNDRLAFLGKRIVDLQISLALLQSPVISPEANASSSYPRILKSLSEHPALAGLENLTPFMKSSVLTPMRLAQVGNSHGLNRVIRWKPRKSDRLHSSGFETVMSHTIYSIIGAVALKRGGDVAVKVAREKVLQPLGLR